MTVLARPATIVKGNPVLSSERERAPPPQQTPNCMYDSNKNLVINPRWVHRINGFSDFVHRPESKELEDKNTTFSMGSNRVSGSPHLRKERVPVSETLCFYLLIFKIRTMDEVQKLINSVCYTPSSEPCRICPDGCYIPRQTGRLNVGRNITLILTITYISSHLVTVC
jgi:hypothetical protein